MTICIAPPNVADAVSADALGDPLMDRQVTQGSRHAVGVFADAGPLAQAYQELAQVGFEADDLCLMATAGAVNRNSGTGGPRPQQAAASTDENRDLAHDLLRDLTPSGAYCAAGPVYSSSGSIRDCIGQEDDETTGDWLGDVLGTWIARHAAEFLEDRLAEGKALLWARVGRGDDPNREHLACTILLNHSSESVRVLDFAYRA